jgi:transposase
MANWQSARGRHPGSDRRVALRAEAGYPWRLLPKDFPPKSTVHSYFELWTSDGTLERIHDALYVAVREQEGHQASPSAAILDSQSAKSAQKTL